MSIGSTYTASMSEKANLRKLIESWFGKKFTNDEAAADFDMAKLLGKRCLLNITHTEKGDKKYANISAATPLPKGMVSNEPQHNPSLYFSLEMPDQKAFEALPKWLKDKVNARLPEDKQEPDGDREEALAGSDEFDDSIPF